MRIRTTIAVGGLLLVTSGCSPYLGVAERDFVQGRYLEASEVLGAHEGDVGGLSPRRQAQYGLVRGLSLLVLGDPAGAHRWLGFAQRLELAVPGTLDPRQRVALAGGLDDLARAPGGLRYADSPRLPAADLAGARPGAALR